MTAALNMKGVSEEIGIPVIYSYLDGEELDVHEAQLSSVIDDPKRFLERVRSKFRHTLWMH